MRKDWKYRRGDVYLADCGEWHGSIQGGIRYMAHLSDKHMAEISRCLEVELALNSDEQEENNV